VNVFLSLEFFFRLFCFFLKIIFFRQDLHSVARAFARGFRDQGMDIDDRDAVTFETDESNFEREVFGNAPRKPDLVMIILPSNDSRLYMDLKEICDRFEPLIAFCIPFS
jgi:hypothetical protein